MHTLMREAATWQDQEPASMAERGIRSFMYKNASDKLDSGFVVLTDSINTTTQREELQKWVSKASRSKKVKYSTWCGAVFVIVFKEQIEAIAFYLTHV